MAQLTRTELKELTKKPADEIDVPSETLAPPSFIKNKLSSELGIPKRDVDRYLKVLAIKANKIDQKYEMIEAAENLPSPTLSQKASMIYSKKSSQVMSRKPSTISRRSSSGSPMKKSSSVERHSSTAKFQVDEFENQAPGVEKLSNTILLKKQSSGREVNLGKLIQKLD